jgi:LuxR family maltose regulon positive regulatory protein
VRCFIACERNDVEQAERLAQAALGLLPDADSTFRAGVRGALGDVYRRNGRWEESRHNYLITLTHTSTYENYVQSIHAYGALADLGFRRGRLREAAAYWRKALEVIDDEELWGAYPLPVLGWVHIRLGEILYEWNELDAVRGHLELGQAQARLGGDPRSIIAGALLEARLRVAEGESGRAAVALDQARSAIGDAEYPEWRSAFDLCQVALWLAAGHPGTAVSWATDAAVDVEAPPDSEPSRLALARALLAAGDPASIQRARSVLEPLLAAADAEGRLGIVVETLALLAATRWAANDQPGALEAIERALRLAEPEGYVRSFVDLGPPVIRVLQAARDRGVMPETVTGLLNAASAGGGEPGRVALPEPLSEREKEVLSRLAAGLTNREIGDALFISPETVKKHTGSIYGKLGARNRTEAVRVARDLGLLD